MEQDDKEKSQASCFIQPRRTSPESHKVVEASEGYYSRVFGNGECLIKSAIPPPAPPSSLVGDWEV